MSQQGREEPALVLVLRWVLRWGAKGRTGEGRNSSHDDQGRRNAMNASRHPVSRRRRAIAQTQLLYSPVPFSRFFPLPHHLRSPQTTTRSTCLPTQLLGLTTTVKASPSSCFNLDAALSPWSRPGATLCAAEKRGDCLPSKLTRALIDRLNVNTCNAAAGRLRP